jgi:hypothetical protein
MGFFFVRYYFFWNHLKAMPCETRVQNQMPNTGQLRIQHNAWMLAVAFPLEQQVGLPKRE